MDSRNQNWYRSAVHTGIPYYGIFGMLMLGGYCTHKAAAAYAHRQASAGHLTARGIAIAEVFNPFGPSVTTRSDDRWFYVESNGMPNHRMMVGITSWQQQVPIPQNYTGQNAWQFPLKPKVAANPLSGKSHFLRGAMAIAADGVPIFNALNNRGEDSFAIGELDEFGGHCGRADDYHYHIAPPYITKISGKNHPVAFALDGYAIYGYTEPDGTAVGKLDAFNGHESSTLGYHYHATKTFPYLNGGFHGEVVERDGQVEPQASARPIRPAMNPLRGAKITGFEQPGPGNYQLTCTMDGLTYRVNYTLQQDGSYRFEYVDGGGKTVSETYQTDVRNAPPQDNSQRGGGDDRRRGPVEEAQPEDTAPTDKTGKFTLRSSGLGDHSMLSVKYTGDGAGISPPLQWSGVPDGTKSFALIMHHVDPQGVTKWYWTLYNISPNVHALAENSSGVGIAGNNSVDNHIGYAPPHSKGPGLKTYTVSLYALSDMLDIKKPANSVSRAGLLTAMKGHVIAVTRLNVSAISKGAPEGMQGKAPPPPPQ